MLGNEVNFVALIDDKNPRTKIVLLAVIVIIWGKIVR